MELNMHSECASLSGLEDILGCNFDTVLINFLAALVCMLACISLATTLETGGCE